MIVWFRAPWVSLSSVLDRTNSNCVDRKKKKENEHIFQHVNHIGHTWLFSFFSLDSVRSSNIIITKHRRTPVKRLATSWFFFTRLFTRSVSLSFLVSLLLSEPHYSILFLFSFSFLFKNRSTYEGSILFRTFVFVYDVCHSFEYGQKFTPETNWIVEISTSRGENATFQNSSRVSSRLYKRP